MAVAWSPVASARGRVFIAGDAAHIWVPYAGYGMNAGIADAMNLSWLLAAHLNGWAPASILDAYEAERRPITEQVSRFAMSHAEREIEAAGRRADRYRGRGPEGERIRAEIGQLCCRHQRAPVLLRRVEFRRLLRRARRSSRMMARRTRPTRCRASRRRRCRAAARRMCGSRDGRSLYDALGPEFTLLRFDPAVDVSQLINAARDRHLPLHVLDLTPDEAGAAYTSKLVLSRPDQHVAWRGNAIPAEPLALIDLLRGATTP